MKEKFYRSEFIPSERKEKIYSQLEIEQDFLEMLEKLRRRKQIQARYFQKESHGFRGQDRDYRKLWKKEKEKIEKTKVLKMEEMKSKKIKTRDFHNGLDDLLKVEKIQSKEIKTKDLHSILDGFLNLLRKKGIRVSTPEWLQFMTVIYEKAKIDNLTELVENNDLFNKFRLYAKTTLIKNKTDEAIFHEAFNEYFEFIAKIFQYELDNDLFQEKNFKKLKDRDFDKDELTKKEQQKITDELKKHYQQKKEEEKKFRDSGLEPKLKEKLGIQEVKENLSEDENHEDNESVHGGKKDQHNDILKKEDLSKQGGGDQKKGSRFAERIQQDFIYEGEKLDKQAIQEREKRVGKIDKRLRDEKRPDKASMREVIRNIRRIILDVSEIKNKNIDLRRTVENFARRDFRFDYQREREKQPEIVLFIDVGGPVDAWSPLVKELAEEMVKGLTKLEIYLFHNNLYGYVWKPDPKNLLASSYAKANSLIDIKSIIKRRKKVIIYGDAEMSYFEFEEDGWPPSKNDERIKKFGMGGRECLKFIKNKSNSVVWINPIFKKEWTEHDDSDTINEIANIIPMYDLTIGGIEDAIKDLIKK